MGVPEALRNTSKGRLKYAREQTADDVQALINEVSASPKLQAYHHESPTNRNDNRVIKSLQPYKGDKIDKSKDDKDSSCRDETAKEKVEIAPDMRKEVDVKRDNLKTSNRSFYRSPPTSPEYSRTSLKIRQYEAMWENEAKRSVDAKVQEFENKSDELQKMVEQKANELERKEQMQMKQLYEKTAKLQLKEKTETTKQTQQMRDIHKARKKKQEDMLLEGERKKQILQEEERKRGERRLVIKQYFAKIKELIDKIMSEYDGCLYKSYIGEAGQKPRQLFTNILAKAESTLQKAEPAQEDVQAVISLLEYSKNVNDYMLKLIEEATKKGKAEEAEKAKQQQQQQLQEQQKAAAEKVQAAASAKGNQTASASGSRQSVIDEVVTEYEAYKAKLDDTQKQLAPFTSDVKMKKYRFELQKAVNLPINAISPVDGAHLRDKLQKLTHLLSGHQIEGKHLTAKDAPEGIAFCKNLIAKMFVKKGEEQVSSKHDTAFAIAMVAVGLWFEYNDLGELMLAHFINFCPYIVPLYFPKDNNMSTQEYHKLLGYKVDDDGTIEAQDKFLKRMSGLMRLYAAILVSWPPRANCLHPHGIEHAWIWLSRVLNMDPQPDITATLTYDLLQVTGHALYSTYKLQFVKLLYILHKNFLPQLQKVSVAGGPVTRLQLYLEQTLNNFKMKQGMAPPEGYLPQNFWFT